MYMKKYLFLCLLLVITSHAFAQTAKLKSIPHKLEYLNDAVSYALTDTTLEISAKGKTNLFNNPNGKYSVQDAPMVLFQPKGEFTFSAKVAGKLQEIYDVAALVIYQDKNTWAKLCYENSVDKKPTIVSIVTREYSDDCNSMETGDFAYLSIVRKKNNEYYFLYSPDGEKWSVVRHFHLDAKNIKIGFAVHGSRGNGFTGQFSDIKFKNSAMAGL